MAGLLPDWMVGPISADAGRISQPEQDPPRAAGTRDPSGPRLGEDLISEVLFVVRPDGGERDPTADAARLTTLGSLLRRTSLDELPQLFNVALGEMSLVGPRPHPIELNKAFKSRIPKYMLRHKVKPGITGWAQVNGLRGETNTLDKMQKRIEYDLFYIENWSLLLDLKIIFQTFINAVKGEDKAY